MLQAEPQWLASRDILLFKQNEQARREKLTVLEKRSKCVKRVHHEYS